MNILIILISYACLFGNIACSQSSHSQNLMKRGKPPVKDANGAEIDLNMPAQSEEVNPAQDKITPTSQPQPQAKKQNYTLRTYTPRSIKNEYSKKSGAQRSRKFREKRRSDPQRLQEYLAGERMRKTRKRERPKFDYQTHLITLEKMNKLNAEQSIKLAAYRERRKISKKTYLDRKKARGNTSSGVEQAKE